MASKQDIPPPNLHEEKLDARPVSLKILGHSLEAQTNAGGLQCIIVLDSSSPFPVSLGLPSHKEVKKNTCFLQVTRPYDKFMPFLAAEEGMKLTCRLGDYLNLYRFFKHRWPLVCSKILVSAEKMVNPDSWIQFGQHLQFIEPGVVNYSVRIGELDLRAECRYVQEGKKLQPVVVARLHSEKQHVELPLPTCLELFSSFNDYISLEEKYLSQK